MDRFPVTDHLTWAFLRHADRVRSIKPRDVFWFCLAGCMYAGIIGVAVGWWSGK